MSNRLKNDDKHMSEVEQRFWAKFPTLSAHDQEDEHSDLITRLENTARSYFKSEPESSVTMNNFSGDKLAQYCAVVALAYQKRVLVYHDTEDDIMGALYVKGCVVDCTVFVVTSDVETAQKLKLAGLFPVIVESMDWMPTNESDYDIAVNRQHDTGVWVIQDEHDCLGMKVAWPVRYGKVMIGGFICE